MWVTSSALNTLQVSGAYVYAQPPTPVAGQGIDTSLFGIVGTGSWGPLDTPLPISDSNSLFGNFGSYATCGQDPNSLVTEAQFALAFASNGLGVRRSDGTDTAASVAVKDTAGTNGFTITGFYTGAEGNNISYSLTVGSNSTVGSPTMTLTLQRLGFKPEVYPNLPNATTGGFAAAAISAINNGISGVCPASQIAVASLLGAASTAGFVATTAPVFLAGGTNGAAPTSTQLIGTDSVTGARTGIYALRGTGVQQFCLAGNSDSAQYAALATFAQSEGSLAIALLPSGTSSDAAVTAKQTANFNSQNGALVKDWVNFTDPNTGLQRLVSPLGDVLGLIASLPPEASPCNEPARGISNIISTERTGKPYSYGEKRELQAAGILYITTQTPRGGGLFGLPHGQNASTSAVGVNAPSGNISYTRMTNYLGASAVALLGQFVGKLQGTQPNDPVRAAAKACLSQWLEGLKNAGRIDDYRVTLDLTNNTPLTIAEGFALALVQVAYMNEIKFFLCTLQGGSAVQLSLGNTPNNQFLQAA